MTGMSIMPGVRQLNRAQQIQQYYETKEYRLCPIALKRYLRKSKLTFGARELFDLLLDESTFSDDWSTNISRARMSEELGRSIKTISRLLLELEKSNYIIRKLNPSQASTLYINFPEDLIEALEDAPDRRKAKAIKKCGTVETFGSTESLEKVHDADIGYTQKWGGDLPKNETPTIYNTKQYTNNNHCVKKEHSAVNENPIVVSSEISKFPLDNSLSADEIGTETQTSQHREAMGKEFGGYSDGNPQALDFFADKQEKGVNQEQVSVLEASIQGLKGETDSLYVQLSVEQDRGEKLRLMDLVRDKNERLSSLENQLASLQVKAKPHKALREGQRQLRAGQVERIRIAVLAAYGDASEARRVGLDVMEQIRYGSLAKKSYKTGNVMSVALAVNTACNMLIIARAVLFHITHKVWIIRRLLESRFSEIINCHSFFFRSNCNFPMKSITYSDIKATFKWRFWNIASRLT